MHKPITYSANFPSLNWPLKKKKKSISGDFPGGPVVKNLPSNGEDTSLIHGWGTKIPHASGQLSWRAATAEPRHSGASALPQEKPLYHNKDLEQPKKKKKKTKKNTLLKPRRIWAFSALTILDSLRGTLQ